jgi:hypothetical protein
MDLSLSRSDKTDAPLVRWSGKLTHLESAPSRCTRNAVEPPSSLENSVFLHLQAGPA